MTSEFSAGGGERGVGVVRLSLTEIRQHPSRYLAMLLAIVLSVTFLAVTQIVLATETNAQAARTALFTTRADIVINSYVWNSDRALADRDNALAIARSTMAGDPAVAEVEAFQQVRGEFINGDKIASVMLTTALRSPGLRWADPIEGHLPESSTEVMLAVPTAQQLGIGVGDTVQLNVPDAPLLTVTGLARERGYAAPPAYVSTDVIDIVGDTLPPPNPGLIINPKSTAGTTPGSSGSAVGVRLLVRTHQSSQAPEVVARVAKAMYDAGYLRIVAEAKLAETVRDEAAVAAGRSPSATPLLVTTAAGVGLLVGGLIVASTLRILLTQRRRQVALLRAVGATRRQVSTMVLTEAALLGAVGSLVAVPLAVAVAAVVSGQITHGMDYGLVIPWDLVALSTLLGFVITVVAAAGPVLRITRVSPLEALQPASVRRRSSWSRGVGVACAVAALLGVVGLVAALMGFVPEDTRLWVGVGAALIVAVAGLVATPLYVPALMQVVAEPLVRRYPLAGVAIGNAVRNPGRVGATAAALLLAVGLMVVVQVGVAGVRSAAFAEIDRSYPIDIALQSAVKGPDFADGGGSAGNRDQDGRLIGFAPDALEIVRSTPGVASAVMVPMSDTTVLMTGAFVFGQYPVAPLTPEAAAALRFPIELSDQQIGAPADAMSALRAVEGTTAQVHPFSGKMIRGTLTRADVGPDMLVVTPNTFADMETPARDGLILVTLTHPDEGQSVGAELRSRLLAANPGLHLGGSAEQKAALRTMLDDLTSVMTGLLGVAALVGIIGVANTLSLSVIERTREHALLRALGVIRAELRGMVLVEALLIAVIAVALGTLAGLGLGWAAARLISDALGLPSPGLVIDVLPLVITVLLVLLAAAAAAVLPGRRAASASPVEALADVG